MNNVWLGKMVKFALRSTKKLVRFCLPLECSGLFCSFLFCQNHCICLSCLTGLCLEVVL